MAKILLIDDVMEVRFSMRVALEGAGHDIVEASDGAEALSLIDQSRFDVVLTDLFLPRVDGFELLREARRLDPRQRIIAFTGGGAQFGDGWRGYLSDNFKFDAILT